MYNDDDDADFEIGNDEEEKFDGLYGEKFSFCESGEVSILIQSNGKRGAKKSSQ